MSLGIETIRKSKFFRIICHIIVISFALNTIFPPRLSFAQNLPIAGSSISLSQPFNPPVLKGLKVYPNEPLKFDFIIDPGSQPQEQKEFQEESTKLIKYFLAAVTTPEKDLWVNLSPYEKDRIVPESFGQTEMGRDLLSQDYILKQITASVMQPESETGKKFWAKVYEESYKKYGTTDISVDTFNKVWIAPDKVIVYEDKGVAFIGESRLQVMLESDYIAQRSASKEKIQKASSPKAEISQEILREVIIPILEKEVNQGKNFAPLRQVYQSLILAVWYKKRLKDSILNYVYADKNKVAGIDIDDKAQKEKIYAQYLEVFKKGVCNYMKEEYDPKEKKIIAKKYFSGGFDAAMLSEKIDTKPMSFLSKIGFSFKKVLLLTVALTALNATTLFAQQPTSIKEKAPITIVQEQADTQTNPLREQSLHHIFDSVHPKDINDQRIQNHIIDKIVSPFARHEIRKNNIKTQRDQFFPYRLGVKLSKYILGKDIKKYISPKGRTKYKIIYVEGLKENAGVNIYYAYSIHDIKFISRKFNFVFIDKAYKDLPKSLIADEAKEQIKERRAFFKPMQDVANKTSQKQAQRFFGGLSFLALLATLYFRYSLPAAVNGLRSKKMLRKAIIEEKDIKISSIDDGYGVFLKASNMDFSVNRSSGVTMQLPDGYVMNWDGTFPWNSLSRRIATFSLQNGSYWRHSHRIIGKKLPNYLKDQLLKKYLPPEDLKRFGKLYSRQGLNIKSISWYQIPGLFFMLEFLSRRSPEEREVIYERWKSDQSFAISLNEVFSRKEKGKAYYETLFRVLQPAVLEGKDWDAVYDCLAVADPSLNLFQHILENDEIARAFFLLVAMVGKDDTKSLLQGLIIPLMSRAIPLGSKKETTFEEELYGLLRGLRDLWQYWNDGSLNLYNSVNNLYSLLSRLEDMHLKKGYQKSLFVLTMTLKKLQSYEVSASSLFDVLSHMKDNFSVDTLLRIGNSMEKFIREQVSQGKTVSSLERFITIMAPCFTADNFDHVFNKYEELANVFEEDRVLFKEILLAFKDRLTPQNYVSFFDQLKNIQSSLSLSTDVIRDGFSKIISPFVTADNMLNILKSLKSPEVLFDYFFKKVNSAEDFNNLMPKEIPQKQEFLQQTQALWEYLLSDNQLFAKKAKDIFEKFKNEKDKEGIRFLNPRQEKNSEKVAILAKKTGVNIKLMRYLVAHGGWGRLNDKNFFPLINELSRQFNREKTWHPKARRMEEDEKIAVFDLLFDAQTDLHRAQYIFNKFFYNDPQQYAIPLVKITELLKYISIEDLQKVIRSIEEDPKQSLDEVQQNLRNWLNFQNGMRGAVEHLNVDAIMKEFQYITANLFVLDEQLDKLHEIFKIFSEKKKSSADLIKFLTDLNSANQFKQLTQIAEEFDAPLDKLIFLKIDSMGKISSQEKFIVQVLQNLNDKNFWKDQFSDMKDFLKTLSAYSYQRILKSMDFKRYPELKDIFEDSKDGIITAQLEIEEKDMIALEEQAQIPHIFFDPLLRMNLSNSGLEKFRDFMRMIGTQKNSSAMLKNTLYEYLQLFASVENENKEMLFETFLDMAIEWNGYLSKDAIIAVHTDLKLLLRAFERALTIEKWVDEVIFLKEEILSSSRKLLGSMNKITKENVMAFTEILAKVKVDAMAGAFKNKGINVSNKDIDILTKYFNTHEWRDHENRGIPELMALYVSRQTEQKVVQTMFDALMAEAKGEFSQYKFSSPEYIELINETVNIFAQEMYPENQEFLETMESSDNSYESLMEISGYDDLKERIRRIKEGWEAIVSVDMPDGTTATFTHFFVILFNIGNYPGSTACQSNTYHSSLNKGLGGYTANGTVKTVAYINDEGQVHQTRRMIKLLMAEVDGRKQPVIFVEESTQFGSHGIEKLYELLDKISEKTGMPIVTSTYRPAESLTGRRGENKSVNFFIKHFDEISRSAPYSDAFGGNGIHPDQEKTVNVLYPKISYVYKFFDMKDLIVNGPWTPEEIEKVIPQGVHRIIIKDFKNMTAFTENGYFYKPTKVSYRMRTPKTIDDYFSSMESDQRQKFRSAQRKIDEALKDGRLDLIKSEDDPQAINDFLKLYEKSMGLKERGRMPLLDAIEKSGLSPEDFVSPAQKRSGLYFRNKKGEIVGGIIVKEHAGYYEISYAATEHYDKERPNETFRELQFYLLCEMINRSIEKGFLEISYGVDTNFYGHHLDTGLMDKKIQSGFRPQVSGTDELMKITDFSIFKMPVFFYSYGPNGELESNVILSQSATQKDLAPFNKMENLGKLNIFILENRKIKPIHKEDLAMDAKDSAMINEEADFTKGGIDFEIDEEDIDIRSHGEEFKFNMPKEQMKQLKNADGFMPVIINIQPLENLPMFLGIGEQSHQKIASST